jgi:transmembrane sensor
MSGSEKRQSSRDMSPPELPAQRTFSSTATEKEALVWLQLLTSGEPKAWDLKAFRRWLSLDPAHRAVFNEVKHRWDPIRLPEGAARRAQAARTAAAPARVRRLPDPGRRAWLGAAASAAAVAGLVTVYAPPGLWSTLVEGGADDRTDAGEQRTLALGDSVRVTLNTRTSARRQVVGGRTVGLDLIAGEAAIDLKDTGQAFAVVAGSGRCLGESGQFEVRYLDRKVRVTCIEGSVRVEHPAGVRTLQARQQTVYDDKALSGVASIEPAQVSAWRGGELLFRQTRLDEVIEEINRYRPGRVVLMNAAARAQAVNGRFAIGSLDLALSQLQHAFGLEARSLPGGLLILS